MQMPLVGIRFNGDIPVPNEPRILQRSNEQHPTIDTDALDPRLIDMRGIQPVPGRSRYPFSIGHMSTSFLGTNGAIRQVSSVSLLEITWLLSSAE